MIKILKANTLCRNKLCDKGPNNTRAYFYSCKYCSRTNSWKSIACCPECFVAYQEQVVVARTKDRVIEPDPFNRTDMTQEQPNDLMATSIEEVREESINEITDAGYGGVLQDEGFAATVKKINEDIKAAEIEETAKPKTTRRPRKKKVVEAEVPQE